MKPIYSFHSCGVTTRIRQDKNLIESKESRDDDFSHHGFFNSKISRRDNKMEPVKRRKFFKESVYTSGGAIISSAAGQVEITGS